MDYNIIYCTTVSNIVNGVEQKILAQFDSLQNIHKSTHLLLVSSTPPGEALQEEINKRINVSLLINTSHKVKNPFLRRKEKFKMITDFLQSFDSSRSIIYFRYPGADFIFRNFLKANSNYKFITEHQEIENTFSRGKLKGRFRIIAFDFLWGKDVRKLITGYVGVTPEITSFELSYIKKLDKFSITVGNGINVENYPVRQLLISKPKEIKLLFVGGGYRHHGLDRLLNSIAYYYKNNNRPDYNINLRIVGSGKQMNVIKKQTIQLDLDQYVSFLGFCEGEELTKQFTWADVAVGSLGLHRIGLKHSSTLKAREYFSRGIPFFWSTIDIDLPEDNPYVLQLEANENTFNMHDVIDFALKTREMHKHPYEMREYAENNLDWSQKMENLKSFFDKIMENLKSSR